MNSSAVFMEICQSQSLLHKQSLKSELFVIKYCLEVMSISYGFPQCWCTDGGCSYGHRSLNSLKNTYNSLGNFSHKERDVSFSISENVGLRSLFRSEQPDTFPCQFYKVSLIAANVPSLHLEGLRVCRNMGYYGLLEKFQVLFKKKFNVMLVSKKGKWFWFLIACSVNLCQKQTTLNHMRQKKNREFSIFHV